MPFDPVDPKQSFPALEHGILKYWKEEDTFKRSLRNRAKVTGDVLNGADAGVEKFSFYDGPPFATGLPHYGHLLAGTIKDVIPRYQAMKGKYVERRFGWDCHGLPVENIIEKENNITNHKQIEEMGVGVFNDMCRTAVLRYTTEWRKTVERMGRWVDMDHDYRTMDPDYMESIWWVVKQLADKNLLYEGHKPMHICPRCVTPLSNFEVTQGYKDITDYSVYVKLELEDEPGTYVVIWTTTAWTLPGNTLAAIHPKIAYVRVKHGNDVLIMAQDLVEKVMGDEEHEILGDIKTKELIGKKYKPMFPYFGEDIKKKGFRIVAADYVTTDSGTGIVHLAPAFGEEDFYLGQKEGVPLLQHVGMDGKFIEQVTDFAGMDVKPIDDPSKMDHKIADYLQKKGLLFKGEKFKHSYPHCWRCDSPLLNYATSSWFVAVEKIKEQMLKSNSQTEWVPSHVRDGRFGNWLENARDWAISRNRYWGTPLPIWKQDGGDLQEVLESRADLMRKNLIRFTKLTALRHAQSEGNLIPIYQGKVPGTPLTSLGKQQAQAAAAQLKGEKIAVIYASPLQRAQETAAAIAKNTGAQVITDDRLREIEFGDYEGKTVDFSDLAFVKARRAHKLESNAPESLYHFAGMETWSDTNARVQSFLKEVLPKHRGEHIVVVSHADPIQNIKHFFNKEDPVKLSHQPYPTFARPHTFYYDHDRDAEVDLHKDKVDEIVWDGPKTNRSVDITFVRHGETDWNAAGKSGSFTDTPLNENGKKQAEKAAAKLGKKKFDAIISSNLKRASETAHMISKETGVEVLESELFQERLYGEWEGKTDEEIQKMTGAGNEESSNPSFSFLTPKGGESLSQFLARMRKAHEFLLENYAGKKVVVVAHEGTFRGLSAITKNLTYEEAVNTNIENGGIDSLSASPIMRRIPEVLDCWFESGSMPYAQNHFPFEGKTDSPIGFPADFIAEGIDQTRGWFYTLTVLASALFQKPAFHHCIVNGTVLAEDGKKMSKRLKNYPDPMELVEQHGADAVRFTLMSSPAVRGEDLRFSSKLVEESLRSVLLPFWNTYSFFVTYANAAGFSPISGRRASTHPLDVWMTAHIQDLVNRMTEQLDNYDLSATCSELFESIDAITNWYVRLSRRRFAGKISMDSADSVYGEKTDASDEDQEDALSTLYEVLIKLSQVLAPFCPYITDAVYLNLTGDDHGSVHLTDWPAVRTLSDQEQELLTRNTALRTIVSLGLSLRSDKKIKVRQPLPSVTLAIPKNLELSASGLELLRQELNVKQVLFAEKPEELAEVIALVDARKAGARLGGKVQEIIKAGKAGEFSIQEDGSFLILDEVLFANEASIHYRGKEGKDVAADQGIVVSLDTKITPELVLEGEARELIRHIQKLRKELGYEVGDKVELSITGADDVLSQFEKLIMQETDSAIMKKTGKGYPVEINEGKTAEVVIAPKGE